jgi:tyrosinase
VVFNQAARVAVVARISSRPVRAYLNLENVKGAGVPRNYEVYVDVPELPPASAGQARKPLLAGHLSTFGVRKASSPSGQHGGAGITTVIEISQLVEQLHRERNWDGARLDVFFIPSSPKADSLVAKSGQLEVGRISVYYG